MKFLRRVVVSLLVAFVGLAILGAVSRPARPAMRLSRAVVELDGMTLAYHQEGTGRDLVLIHGGMGSAEDFEPILSQLARTHRVTAFDRPGFGASTIGAGDYTITANARRIAQGIEKLGLVRPILVGHSHGGAIALRIAKDFPERVSGLVLLAPSTFVPPGPVKLMDRALAIPYFGEGLATVAGPFVGPRIITRVVEELLGPDKNRVPNDFLSWRIATWTHSKIFATRSRQNVSNPDELAALSASYPSLRVRTTVFWCAQDPSEGTTSIDSHRLANTLPNSHEIPLTDCGHYVQYRHPDEIVEELSTL